MLGVKANDAPKPGLKGEGICYGWLVERLGNPEVAKAKVVSSCWKSYFVSAPTVQMAGTY